MYESFYGLTDKPFALTPNPRFVFYSQQYREAEGQLLYGINNREGFMLVTGHPGTGKTTLCRDLIEKLDRSRVHSALVFNPFLNAVEMLAALLTEFGVTVPPGASRKDLLDRLNEFLLAQLALGKSCVAIFDEAQHLSPEFLEQIRVLSNLETDQEKLLQIVLVGQPELLDRIRSHGMAQLDQRVSIRCTLSDLNEQEADRYIHHRLNVAGARGQVRFAPRAVHDIFEAAQGVPRLINLICDRAMLAGYADQTRDIGPQHVKKAVLALRGEEADLRSAVTTAPRGRGRQLPLIPVAATILVAAGLFAWYQHGAAQVSSDQSLYNDATRAAAPADKERLYRALTEKFPGSIYAPEAFMGLAQVQLGRGDDTGAIASLEQASTRVQDPAEKSSIAVYTAVAELAIGDTLNACRALSTADSSASHNTLLRPDVESVAPHCAGAQPVSSVGGNVTGVPEDSATTSAAHLKADSAAKRTTRPPSHPGQD